MSDSEKSIFETMTEAQILELVKERGLPGLRPFCKTEEDLERFVDIVEKYIGEIFPGMAPATAAAAPDAEEKKPETEKPEGEEERDASKGTILSDEDRAKLDAMEAEFEKQAMKEMSEEKRQQLAAWKKIRNKGVIPIKFGDEHLPLHLQKRKILFLCSDNSCISQMAEAWTFKMFHEVFDCVSAGFDPKPMVDPLAVATLMAQDIDICSWKTKSIVDVQEIKFDMICPLDDISHAKAKDIDWKGAQLIGGKFDIPTIDKLKASREEMVAARKAQRAVKELERRQAAGEKIELEDLLQEPGLDERLAAEDPEGDDVDEVDEEIDPRIRLMPDYRDLSSGVMGFVESIPQILAFMNSGQ